MPVIQREVSVAAGGVNENLLSGSAFEFARQNSLVSLGICADVEGAFVTVQSGADIVAEEFTPAVYDRFPVIPDEMYVNDVVDSNDRILLPWRNPTGGAIVVRAVAQLSA